MAEYPLSIQLLLFIYMKRGKIPFLLRGIDLRNLKDFVNLKPQ